MWEAGEPGLFAAEHGSSTAVLLGTGAVSVFPVAFEEEKALLVCSVFPNAEQNFTLRDLAYGNVFDRKAYPITTG